MTIHAPHHPGLFIRSRMKASHCIDSFRAIGVNHRDPRDCLMIRIRSNILNLLFVMPAVNAAVRSCCVSSSHMHHENGICQRVLLVIAKALLHYELIPYIAGSGMAALAGDSGWRQLVAGHDRLGIAMKQDHQKLLRSVGLGLDVTWN